MSNPVQMRWRRVAVPFREVVANAQATYRVRESVLIEVEGPDGGRGIGEAALPAGASFREHGPEIDAFMAATASVVAGRPSSDGRAHLELPAFVPGAWSAAMACGVETALVDLAARQEGLPLWRWLAGEARIPLDAEQPVIEANGLVDLVEPGQAAAAAARLVRDGFATIKLKVGGDPSSSAETVAAVRAAVGPDVELRCDANRSWGEAEAARFLASCAPSRVELCEEPLAEPGGDFAALAALRKSSAVPVAVDESTRTLGALERALAADAADALVVKPMASGLWESVAMVGRAREAGLPVIVTTTFDLAPGTALAMHVAALAAVPRPACGLATADLVADLLGHRVPEVRSGTVTLPGAPGLGVELDHHAIEKYAVGPWEDART